MKLSHYWCPSSFHLNSLKSTLKGSGKRYGAYLINRKSSQKTLGKHPDTSIRVVAGCPHQAGIKCPVCA